MAEQMRIDRPAHRAQIAAVDIAHQLAGKVPPIDRDRHAALVKRKPGDLPSRPFDRGLGQPQALHPSLERKVARAFARIEMLRHADRKRFRKLHMARGAVVALARVFNDQLPVGVFDQYARGGELGVLEVMRRGIGGKFVAERIDRRRDLRQAYQNGPGDALQSDRLEPMLALVEPRWHSPGRQQRAIEIVRPAVIRAD